MPTAIRFGLPLAAVALTAAACGGCTGTTSTTGGGVASTSTPRGPATVEAQSGSLGTFLTDQSGMTLYLYTPDSATASTCSGTCATLWPPLTTTGMPSTAGSVMAGKLGTITRSDGTKQVTYAGHPLYFYQGDSGTGQTNGQGQIGNGQNQIGVWYLLTPAGTQITTSLAPPSASGGA